MPDTKPILEVARETLVMFPNTQAYYTLRRLAQEVIDMHAALAGLMGLIDTGVLVRDTRNDHDPEPGWAIRQVPMVIAIAKANEVLSH